MSETTVAAPSVLRGLGAITSHLENEERKREERKNKGDGAKFLSLKDGDTATGHFLQELDESAEHFSEKNDLGALIIEHQHPKEYRRKAKCTAGTEGQCWACERNSWSWKNEPDYKGGWGQKRKLYIFALLTIKRKDGTVEEPGVYIVNQSANSAKSIVDALLEHAREFGTILDRQFKITRKGGDFNNTSYILTALKEDKELFDATEHEAGDVTRLVKDVPYERQEAFYMGEESGSTETKSEEPAETFSSALQDQKW